VYRAHPGRDGRRARGCVGRATSYRNRRVTTDDAHASSSSLVEFSGRTFSLSDGSLAYELAANLETVGPADLAGGTRGVGAHPKLDRVSGELYLISSPGDAASLIHVISPGGMTRRTRSIDNAPGPVRDLALTTRHIVVVADGAIGMVDRHDTESFSWHTIDSTAPVRVVSAHDGDTLVMYVTTPALERWSLHRDQREVRRTVIDPTPQSAGRINETRSGLPHRYLYSVAGQAVVKHDLLDGGRTGHNVANDRRPGEFLFVVDPHRDFREDGGWLLGLVHDDIPRATSLVVLDAAAPESLPIATVRLPRPLPRELHGLWSPTHL
jgi:carotenoid cleavage dioxygenase